MYYLRIHDKVTRYTSNKELDHDNIDYAANDELYERWINIWARINSQGHQQDNLLDSLLETFQNQYFWGIALSFVFYQFTVLIPLFSYYIFGNILNNNYSSLNNIILVILVITLKVSKTFLRTCSDRKLIQVGQGMHKIITKAVLGKSLKVSLLSNKDVVSSELIKMMQIDVQKIQTFPMIKSYVVGHFYSIVFSLAVIVYLYGFAGFIGILVLIVTILIRLCFLKTIYKFEEEVNRETNNRVTKTVDIFNIIKLIKVAALEIPYFKKLVNLREIELEIVHTKNKFETLSVFAVMVSVRIVVLAICLVWISEDYHFSSAVIFTLNLVFININFHVVMTNTTTLNELKLALKSISTFLNAEEIDNRHIQKINDKNVQYAIYIKDGSFYWDLDSKNSLGEQNSRVYLRNVDIAVNKGEFVSIIGRFGSGKSSLFNAILGQMKNESKSSITINGSIAYVSQKPWIVNDTVRNNILFGAQLNPQRYNEVIHYCALQADLDILSNGDHTLIGERGCTLSGGQKARISLARALYSNADIYLLDDILSAVDAHVGSFIFFETIGKYLKGKTILLITHSLHYVKYTHQIVVIDNCQAVATGTYEELKDHEILVKIEASLQRQADGGANMMKKNYVQSDNQFNPNAIVLDDKDEAVSQFIKRCGGTRFVIISIIVMAFASVCSMVYGFWMNSWANSSNYADHSFTNIYIILMVVNASFVITLYFYITHLPILISIYKDMAKGLLFTTLGYFQVTPIAKIIHRMSNDLNKLDKIILYEYYSLTGHLSVLFCFGLSIYGILIRTNRYYILIFFTLYLLVVLYQYRKYIITLKAYRRVEDELKIQVNSYFNETLQGQAVIRAFDRSKSRETDIDSIDHRYGKINNIVNGMDTIVRFILGFSSTIFISAIFIYYFYLESFSEFEVFLLINLLSFQEYLERTNFSLIEFLVKLKSLSKCEELTQVVPESGYQKLLNSWSESNLQQNNQEMCPEGNIQFRDVHARYKVEFGDILRGISIKIKGGQKIGIVGRTGSGKSTLFLALLRIIEAHQGIIFIDGIDISTVSLKTLRKNINFILQDHFLFPGTIRDNVDPSQEHSDDQIRQALQMCGLWSGLLKREKLETIVAEGGENLSVGERQLLNIARSLLNKKKIILVDEATANIDIQTDEAIQKVMSSHFQGCTMLTIAHRITTILNYDRVLVLDKGKVLEFDSPSNLMRSNTSLFRQLYEESSKTKTVV